MYYLAAAADPPTTGWDVLFVLILCAFVFGVLWLMTR